MKRFLSLIVIAATLSSCANIIDIYPVENMSSDQFFASETEVNQAVAGMYHRLGRNGNTTATNNDLPSILYLVLSESRSDNWFMATAPNAQRDQADIRRFQVQTNNGMVSYAFNRLWTLIADANLILQNTVEEEYPVQRAEARFLRAYAYFELVRAWGEVPIILRPITRQDALGMDRDPVAKVYAQIIEDLEHAGRVLEDMPDGTRSGHAGAWAAKTLLAYAYVTMAGYPLNDASAYQKAVETLSPIINDLSGRMPADGEYYKIFDIDEENKWDLFSIQFESGDVGLGSSVPAFSVGGGSSKTTMFPEWVYSDYIFQGEDFRIDNDLVDEMLAEDDTRAMFPILTPGYWEIANPPANPTEADTLEYWTEKPYLLIKYLVRDNTNSKIKAWNDFPLNFPILRVADAYLLYAEALINTGSAANALPWINAVRATAGITPLTGTPTMNDVMDERRREFLGEGKRYFDLVRQGQDVFINSLKTFLDANDQVGTSYGVSYPTSRDMLLPIPYATISIQTNWSQNPQY